MKKKKPPITMRDYLRIFRVVHSVSNSIGNIPGKSCLFYNIVGAVLLERYFKKNAQPVMGAALVRVHDPSSTVVGYYKKSAEDGYISDRNTFHCWVQCKDYAIDFTSPVYHESFSKIGCSHSIPRKMFQKHMSRMSKSPSELMKEGDFYLQPNINLTNDLLVDFSSSFAATDLANICIEWFQRAPKKILPELSMINDLGEVTKMKLNNMKLSGMW